jgi:ribosomal 50S subunit-recycling heat shock protein
MRLDLFLKASRLSARRALAQKLCEAGRVSVNGSRAKSSHAIKLGDEISIRHGTRLTTIRIVAIPAARQTSRKEAGSLYEVIADELLQEHEV